MEDIYAIVYDQAIDCLLHITYILSYHHHVDIYIILSSCRCGFLHHGPYHDQDGQWSVCLDQEEILNINITQYKMLIWYVSMTTWQQHQEATGRYHTIIVVLPSYSPWYLLITIFRTVLITKFGSWYHKTTYLHRPQQEPYQITSTAGSSHVDCYQQLQLLMTVGLPPFPVSFEISLFVPYVLGLSRCMSNASSEPKYGNIRFDD